MDSLAKIWVIGRVQGVGFRYFVYRLAKQYGLTGIVKNLFDGRVYIEIEGDREIMQAFMKDVERGNSWADVVKLDVGWQKFSGKYKTFEIAY
ncbi:MAG TPA: acylphosphatase [Bacteroidetes bacterium]|nr:acylphosphatase [Bacteroidota bacterium]